MVTHFKKVHFPHMGGKLTINIEPICIVYEPDQPPISLTQKVQSWFFNVMETHALICRCTHGTKYSYCFCVPIPCSVQYVDHPPGQPYSCTVLWKPPKASVSLCLTGHRLPCSVTRRRCVQSAKRDWEEWEHFTSCEERVEARGEKNLWPCLW